MISDYAPYIPIILGYIIGCGYLYNIKRSFINTSIKTTGEVIKHTQGTISSGTEGTRREVIQFTTNQGKVVKFPAFMSTSHPVKIGSKVEVLYPEDKPDHAMINNFINLWGFETILFLVGSVVLLVLITGNA